MMFAVIDRNEGSLLYSVHYTRLSTVNVDIV